MELIKEHWSKKDIEEYRTFAKSVMGDEYNCAWEQRIINTKLKCFARTATKARELARDIGKGNYLEFIEELEIKTHLDSILSAFLICKVKDFETFETLLDKYVLTIDNWASSDTLKFGKKDYGKLYTLALKYLKSDKTFVRRTGVNIFFELIRDKNYLQKAFGILDMLSTEKEYYVNMCGAWLLCECFAKYRDETLTYFKHNHTNAFIINKAISKCHDSHRVSAEDKTLLKTFRI